MQVFLGFALSLIVGYAAYQLGALTLSGAAAAVLVGGLIFGLGGLPWAILLLLFFFLLQLVVQGISNKKRFCE